MRCILLPDLLCSKELQPAIDISMACCFEAVSGVASFKES